MYLSLNCSVAKLLNFLVFILLIFKRYTCMPLISTILNIGVILIKMVFKRHAWMRSKRQARTHGIEQSKVLYNLEQILNFQYLVFQDRESTLVPFHYFQVMWPKWTRNSWNIVPSWPQRYNEYCMRKR